MPGSLSGHDEFLLVLQPLRCVFFVMALRPHGRTQDVKKSEQGYPLAV